MQSATLLGRSLWMGLFVVQALGCVLIIPPIEPSSGRCEFTGTTACATCLRASCQTAIDTCCGDPSCAGDEGHSGILDALDECGTGTVASCASRLGEADSAAARALRTCVTTTCKDACVGSAPVAPVVVSWSCGSPIAKDNDCSSCVHDECSATVEECCGDSSCSKSPSLAGDMAACLSDDAPGCYYRLAHASESGVEGKVRACIASCGARCLGTGRAHQSCTLQSGGRYCACSDAEKSGGNECSGASVKGECLRGDEGCTCGTYGCSWSQYRCTCDFQNSSGGSGAATCSVPVESGYGRCCIIVGSRGVSCSCDDLHKPGTCDSSQGEFDTGTCDYEDVKDRLGNLRVPSCSF